MAIWWSRWLRYHFHGSVLYGLRPLKRFSLEWYLHLTMKFCNSSARPLTFSLYWPACPSHLIHLTSPCSTSGQALAPWSGSQSSDHSIPPIFKTNLPRPTHGLIILRVRFWSLDWDNCTYSQSKISFKTTSWNKINSRRSSDVPLH